jgi:cyclophilin family peptidyl-prolyl cis-trans isomerase
MPSDKRQRQDEGRLNRRIAEQAVAKKQTRNRNAVRFGIAAVVVLGGFFAYSLLTKDDGDKVDTKADESPAAIGSTACPPEDGAQVRTTTFSSGPRGCIDVDKEYTAEIVTSRGDVTVELDPKAAPKAVNSFVFLARNKYYEGVSFHRIIPGFVVQGGDANGNPPGTGGPGYEFADELPTGEAPFYAVGDLAMANSGPDTNGSQFFIVTGDQGAQLDAKYTRFGKVTSGMDIVKQIEATGSAEGTPSEPTTITSITIEER